MTSGLNTLSRIAGATAAAAIIAGAASAQTLILATDRVGTTLNATGAGIARVVTKNSPLRIVVRPYAGPDGYIDALESGEIQLAALSSSSAHAAVSGKFRSKKVYRNLRIIRSGGGGVALTFLVTRKSGIKTVAQLKGRKVAAEYGGHSVVKNSVGAGLATAGLTWDDVEQVPVTGIVPGVRALSNGRVEAAWSSFGMPAAREANARIGVRYLSFDASQKTLEILRTKMFPGVRLTTVKRNPKVGAETDLHLITYDSYLIGNKDLPDETVTALVAALWDKTSQLVKIHRGLFKFTRDQAVTPLPMVPYHPAAKSFYKGKGVWRAAAEAVEAQFK